MANPISTAVQNQWKFGFSEQRIDQDGAVRQATEEEILAETKSSPGAMVKLLGAGADLLRFDANGQYSEQIHKIAEIQAQEGKTPELIAREAGKAVEDLRNAMRADIKAGVFKVEDSGQVLHNGQPIPKESVGFELNALLIESLTNTVSELNVLKGQIVSVAEFVEQQFSSNEAAEESRELPLLYDNEQFYLFESRTRGGIGNGPDPNWQEKAIPNTPEIKDLQKLKHKPTPLDEFIAKNDTFSALLEGVDPKEYGRELIGLMEGNYKRLLADLPGGTTNWLDNVSDFRIPDGDVDTEDLPDELFSHRGDPPLDTPELKEALKDDHSIKNFPNSRREFRAHEVTFLSNVQVIGPQALVVARDTVDARTSTLSTLSEQLGTNFKVDNSRFNSLIEAMNNYNKSVLDSLRRFSII